MPGDTETRSGWIGLRRLPEESASRAIAVTLLVCAVCAALITTAVSTLRPLQERNRSQQRTERIGDVIASVPGLADALGDRPTGVLEARLVELDTGAYVANADPLSFDAESAARDPATGIALPPERDRANIGRRAKHATVFLVHDESGLRLVVLPIYGAGYVSTLHGYLALDADLDTVRALTFYDHRETPGLGSEIDNPKWQAQWRGKRLRDPAGELRIGVARGQGPATGSDASYEVDGISGATRTGAAVTHLLRFWLGPEGFGPYLAQLQLERERGSS